jgi:cell division protein ZapA
LLIADELNDVRGAAAVVRNESPADVAPDPAYAVAIERIAERVERLAVRLEGAAE